MVAKYDHRGGRLIFKIFYMRPLLQILEERSLFTMPMPLTSAVILGILRARRKFLSKTGSILNRRRVLSLTRLIGFRSVQ